jgi:hypothetical protein
VCIEELKRKVNCEVFSVINDAYILENTKYEKGNTIQNNARQYIQNIVEKENNALFFNAPESEYLKHNICVNPHVEICKTKWNWNPFQIKNNVITNSFLKNIERSPSDYYVIIIPIRNGITKEFHLNKYKSVLLSIIMGNSNIEQVIKQYALKFNVKNQDERNKIYHGAKEILRYFLKAGIIKLI